MADKVQKIIAEIKDRISNYQEYIDSGYDDEEVIKQEELKDLLSFIDSIQKEPKECMYSKDNYTDEDRKALCESCEEECESNKKKEPVSEIDFEQELYKYFGQVKDFTLGMRIAKRFYEIGRNYQESVSEEQVKESLIFKHEDKTCKENGNFLTQEPVSEDLDKEIDNAHKLFYEEVGWDSGEGARAYVADWFAHYFANWQKQQILDSNTTLQSTFELGKQEMKKQMMANAVDATVHIDAGGYPCIPQMELYDYDKDIPLAKEGDKYKVILIKEDLL